MGITEVGTIVAIAVGVYGAILSTFLFIRESRNSRRNVRVICEETIEKWPDDKPARILPKYAAITIRAINTSYRPVVLVAAGFHLSNGEKLEKIGDEAGLPKKIQDGESIGVPFGIASLEKSIESQQHESWIIRFRSPLRIVSGDPLVVRLADFIRDGDDTEYGFGEE